MTFQAEQPRAAYVAPSIPGLKANCLSYVEVLAQSVSVIAPSTVPAAVLGLIFAAAGNGTWLSFLIGMLGLVLVSYNINQFARRSASAGSLYSYIVKGLGSRAGVLGGCALLFGYTLTGMSTLCGFVLTVNALLGPLGWALPSLLLSAIAVVVAFAPRGSRRAALRQSDARLRGRGDRGGARARYRCVEAHGFRN